MTALFEDRTSPPVICRLLRECIPIFRKRMNKILTKVSILMLSNDKETLATYTRQKNVIEVGLGPGLHVNARKGC